jgi:predicted HTH domain antitoxin
MPYIVLKLNVIEILVFYNGGECMLWKIEELNKISQSRAEEVECALNKLFDDNPNIKRAVVVNAYLDKKISLSKAAEELGLHRFELERQFESEGIPIRRISDDDLTAEVRAVIKWE